MPQNASLLYFWKVIASALLRLDRALSGIDQRLNRQRRWPLLLFLFAFVLKALYVLQSARTLNVLVPIMDERYYDMMAQSIAAGDMLQHGAFFMGPLYPYVLGTIYALFGRDFTIVRLIQCAGGAVSVVLTYQLGRLIFRPSVGLAAAIALCMYGTVTFYDGQILMEWLGTLLNVSALFALTLAARKLSWRLFAGAGLLVGLSALARASILGFAVVAILWILFVIRGSRRFVHALAFTVATLATLLPATIHNYVTSRDFVLVTSNAGLNFYIGNREGATGMFRPVPGLDFVGDTTTRNYVERRVGRDMSPSQISRYWFDETMKDIRGDNGRAVRLLLRKAALFANAYEIPQIESSEFAADDNWMLRVLFVRYWWLGALGMLGMLYTVRRWRDYSLLTGFVLSYAATIILFFITARYRIQIAPVMALFSAHAVLVVFPAQLRAARPAVAAMGLLLLLLLVTSPAVMGHSQTEALFRERVHRARRMSELKRGDEAIAEISRAIEMYPQVGEGYAHRAIIYKEQGNALKALEDYARSARLEPGIAETHFDMGQIFRQMSVRREAVREYLAAIAIDSLMVQAHNNLGITYREMGKYEDAIASFHRVIELDPAYAKGYNNLAAALAEAGRLSEAADVLQDAIRRFPKYATSYKNLAMVRVEMKEPEPAISAMSAYLALNPDDVGAKEALRKLHVAASADSMARGRNH